MERQEAMLKITILTKNKFEESNNFVYITWFIYILMQKFFFLVFRIEPTFLVVAGGVGVPQETI